MNNRAGEIYFLSSIKSFLRPLKHWIILNLVWPIKKSKVPKFNVMSSLDTLDYLIKNQCSLVRFGDGELDIIFGHEGPKFQQFCPELANKLKEILSTPTKELLICIPDVLNVDSIESCNLPTQYFWKRFLLINANLLREIIDPSYLYGCSHVSRPYLRLKDKTQSDLIFNKFKEIFSQRDIVIVEGEKTRFGVANDLVSQAKTVKRILGPTKNAFNFYNQILEECLKQERNCLFLVALGPTAKLVVAELSCHGYQAIDVGHLDIEYEHFLRKKENISAIPGKWTNEVDTPYQECDLDLNKYFSEIIVKF